MPGGVDYNKFWARGHMHRIDDIPPGDATLPAALNTFAAHIDGNRQSLHWQRTVRWVEAILFLAGRHYIDDLLVSRLVGSESGELSLLREVVRNIPRPTNDLLSRYVETNVALLTENRPIPRITPKSDRSDDVQAAELSQLTLEYLWEALDLPQVHRQIARIVLTCGVCWLEAYYDPTLPRRMSVPETVMEQAQVAPPSIPGAPAVRTAVERPVPVLDASGRPVIKDQVEYGDVSVRIVSPFEMQVPPVHWWDGEDMGWVMREYYTSKDTLIDKYTGSGKRKMGLNKRDGWYLDGLDRIGSDTKIQDLPVWWWERLSQIVEGPGNTFYVGNAELWQDYTVCRVFDRKPSAKWPRGRTVITAGDQVLYDSPKDKGARAYDPRWPTRWHPYIIYRWEPLPSTDIHCRGLVQKLLPKIKRINSIDTAMIMWRRTVPIAQWIAPKGTAVVEDFFSGRPGGVIEWDPRRSGPQARPEPVFPPPFPEAALTERQQQLVEMDMIAGTEEILRGQRPSGVTSASMLDILRKQALASRSAALQAWDESYQKLGSRLLQEVIRNIDDDPRYAERIRILAREKMSRLTIGTFSGSDLSDNTEVKVDTIAEALISKEARRALAIEFIQYAPAFMSIQEPGLRKALIDELGYEKALTPQGADYDRAKKMISWILNEQFDRVIPLPEDDPYIFHSVMVEEMKAETFYELNPEQQELILKLVDAYRQQIQFREEQALRMELLRAQLQAQAQGKGGGQQAPPFGQENA